MKSFAFKDLANNLTTSTTGSALDASQGKILNDKYDELNQSLSSKVNTTDSRLSDARTPKAHTHDDRYYTESEINAKIMSLRNISLKTLTVPLVPISANSWTQSSTKHGLNTSKIVSLSAFIDGDPSCGVTHCWIDGEYVKWNASNYKSTAAKVTVGVDIRYLS